ncbi:YihY/virulence factor BrkB family protein [Modestobacter sp. VKM Ac-2985]|uniref:YihY/virulence factor BrkB family protein n=1 Tax=Modestobacter sp. VKM Ac-2985 TaxID=3004139 RepID=UPI0022AB7D14|nr:YihY/virulence factor BrkB family protein [Modestobacter sp. VKM Ac-2985]MCZ2837262.1 YihY/virulence factor BrkB family protein [Modestobacter sp. VKM Ac-2985]
MVDDGRQGSAVENIRARVQEKAERRAAQRAAEARVAGNGEGSGASSSAVVRGERREATRPAPEVPDSQEMPGIDADRPTDIPKRGWLQIVKRSWAENNADNMPIIAGGVAFFAFLSIFPALIATISIYGLVASPEQVAAQIESLSDQLPESAQDILTEQLTDITSNAGGALTFGLIASVLGALWTASGGVNNLVKAVNIAYDEVETRNFLKLRALSLALTLGAIVFVLFTFALIAVVPVVLDVLPLGGVGTVLAQVLRWVLLLAVVIGSLAVLYRAAPDRDAPKIRWVSLGSLVVTVIWAVVSVAFSFYVNNFGSYNETYGAIAGVIVLMLWLYLTCYLVLLGAEINAETEHQTARDTTQGDPEPMGKRDAVVADEVPDPPVPAT